MDYLNWHFTMHVLYINKIHYQEDGCSIDSFDGLFCLSLLLKK